MDQDSVIENERAWGEIAELDLSDIESRVRWEKPEWPDKLLKSSVEGYRRWLFLCKVYSENGAYQDDMVPDYFTDVIWDMHILFTHSYHDACDKIFGSYLHHSPEKDPLNAAYIQATESTYELTRKRYVVTFGEEADPEVFYAPYVHLAEGVKEVNARRKIS